jgi:hypothetical protein
MIYQSGDIVKVVNLPERTGMNGWIGGIERFDDATQKYKIEVRSKGVYLKSENVELVNPKIYEADENFSDFVLCIRASPSLASERLCTFKNKKNNRNRIVSEGVTNYITHDNSYITVSIAMRGSTSACLVDGVYCISLHVKYY